MVVERGAVNRSKIVSLLRIGKYEKFYAAQLAERSKDFPYLNAQMGRFGNKF